MNLPVRFTGAWALWPVLAGAGLGSGQAAQAAAGLPLAQLWLAGACVLGAYFLAVYAAALWRLRGAVPCTCGQVQAFFRAWPVRRPLRVKMAACSTPFTYGALCPVVVLPAAGNWQAQQLFYVLAHERMHIVRFDALRKLLFAAALCLHWYSPVVWGVFLLANRDIEFACDEAVVCAQGGAERAPYAHTLLCAEAQRSAFGPFCSCFSENQWRERMKAIMNKKKASFTAAALAVAVFGVGAVAFAAEPPAAEPKLEGTGASSAASEPVEKAQAGSYVLEQVVDKSPEEGVTVTVTTPDGKAQVLKASSGNTQGETGPELRFHLTEAGKAE